MNATKTPRTRDAERWTSRFWSTVYRALRPEDQNLCVPMHNAFNLNRAAQAKTFTFWDNGRKFRVTVEQFEVVNPGRLVPFLSEGGAK